MSTPADWQRIEELNKKVAAAGGVDYEDECREVCYIAAPDMAKRLRRLRELLPECDVQNAIETATDGKWVHFSFDISEARELLTLLEGTRE